MTEFDLSKFANEPWSFDPEDPKISSRLKRTPPAREIQKAEVPCIEELVCSRDGYGLESVGDVQPVQRAIMRALDGRALGDLWRNKSVREAFGGARPPHGKGKRPKTFVLIAGTRCGKSIIAGGSGVRNALTCSLEGLVAGDEIRLPVFATALDTAHQIFSHMLAVAQSNLLRGIISGKTLTSSFRVARQGGLFVQIATIAMSSQGNNAVSRWLGSVIFDEAPRMGSEEETVRSLKASRRAVIDRILEGGQELLVGSPYYPYGDVHELWRTRFGHPDEDCVVVQASGPMMNPKHWTPERLDYVRRTDPFTYVTSGLGRFADSEEALIPSVSIERCMGDEESRPRLKPRKNQRPVEYVASLAIAERSAGWTLVIVGTYGKDQDGQKMIEQAVGKQWFGLPEQPLQPRETFREVADVCRSYGCDQVYMNARFVESLEPLAASLNFGLVGVNVEADARLEMCDVLRAVIVETRIRLTNNRQQYTDLSRVQKKPTVNGTTIQYPSSGDSTNCDFVPPLAVAVLNAPDPPATIEPVYRDPIDARIDGWNPDPFERAALGFF